MPAFTLITKSLSSAKVEDSLFTMAIFRTSLPFVALATFRMHSMASAVSPDMEITITTSPRRSTGSWYRNSEA